MHYSNPHVLGNQTGTSHKRKEYRQPRKLTNLFTFPPGDQIQDSTRDRSYTETGPTLTCLMKMILPYSLRNAPRTLLQLLGHPPPPTARQKCNARFDRTSQSKCICLISTILLDLPPVETIIVRIHRLPKPSHLQPEVPCDTSIILRICYYPKQDILTNYHHHTQSYSSLPTSPNTHVNKGDNSKPSLNI